jgi:hypothetical protein
MLWKTADSERTLWFRGGPGQSPDAEPMAYSCGFVVARGRVQLPTFALGVRCSMQLSYRATGFSVSRAYIQK